MIKVNVTKEANYPVSSPKLKAALRVFFTKKGIVSDSQVDVAVVGEEKMKTLGKKYLNEGGTPHNVLSFVETEVKGDFVNPPDGVIRLGGIVLCFPVIREEAKREGKLIDEKAVELAEHAALHLLGEHHD